MQGRGVYGYDILVVDMSSAPESGELALVVVLIELILVDDVDFAALVGRKDSYFSSFRGSDHVEVVPVFRNAFIGEL